MNKELRTIYEDKLKFINSGIFGIDEYDIEKIVQAAYDLGKSSKKCKEEDNNPYHIDHKRQTKLEL